MILILSLLLAGGAALVVMGLLQARQPATDATSYLRSLDGEHDGGVDQFAQALEESFLARVLAPFGASMRGSVSRFTPVAQRDRVAQQLRLAGVAATMRAEDFIAMKVVAAVAGGGLGFAYLTFAKGSVAMRLGVLILLGVAGVLGPQAWLSRKIDERKHSIFMDMPDVLDLLAISVEAGVGFEGALDIVCRHFDSPLAREFSRTLREMELGLPRREALQNLKKRTEVPELSNFVLALTQADALGMPVGRVLHTQASEMRSKRRMYAREKAGKLPVKMLFPLMIFIFPAIMIVVLGPAASNIQHAFK